MTRLVVNIHLSFKVKLIHLFIANDITSSHPLRLVNYPIAFQPDSSTSSHHDIGRLMDVRADPVNMSIFDNYIKDTLPHVDELTDGENIDAVEHFFWG